ncbi:hypothetical protein NMG60_11004311 [Bertholletia excelsa]
MSLLEVITKASANSNHLTFESSYPIILNPDPILLGLKPQNEDVNDVSPVKRVEGWKILQTDVDVIELGEKFSKKLKRKMKNHNTFDKDEFMGMLTLHLEKSSEKVGISIGVDKSEENYTAKLIEKVGFLMGHEVKGLVMEAVTLLELWELLETLIVCGLVEHSCSSNLIYNLIEKGRSDLICLCIKHFSDLQTSDILSIMRYFLSPNNSTSSSMVSIRKDWESQALLALEKAADKKLKAKKLNLAKEPQFCS